MYDLCKRYFPKELHEAQEILKTPNQSMLNRLGLDGMTKDGEEQEKQEEV